MLPLTVLGTGLALVGIGASVNGVLSTVLVASGVAVSVAAALIYLARRGAGDEETPTVQTQAAEGGEGHGDLRGNVITGSTITVNKPADSSGKTRAPTGEPLLDRSPADLIGIRHEHTSIQATKLLEAFLGHWIPAQGIVVDVDHGQNADGEDEYRVLLQSEGGHYISALFGSRWGKRLEVLSKREAIEIVGQIESVELMNVSLGNCELVDD